MQYLLLSRCIRVASCSCYCNCGHMIGSVVNSSCHDICVDYVLQHGSRDERMSAFLKWLSDHDVDTSAVVIEQFADAGYGLKAARDIKVDMPS